MLILKFLHLLEPLEFFIIFGLISNVPKFKIV